MSVEETKPRGDARDEITQTADGDDRPALRVEGVTKRFGPVVALEDVDLAVSYGEVHGLLGENGAGKSTLMAIVSGALRPSEGTIAIDGESIAELTPQVAKEHGIAIVRQEPALLPDLTVGENLYLAASPHQRPPLAGLYAWAEERLAFWGEKLSFGVHDRIEELRPQARFIVEICKALGQDPRVLILDEPTEHLVREEVELLFRHIRQIAGRGKAVVYISHRINEVKLIADRVTILRNGRSEGTFEARTVSEDRLVDLIIGRKLTAYFPAKPESGASGDVGLRLRGFSARGVAPLERDFLRGQIIGLAGIVDNGQRQLLRALAGLERSQGEARLGDDGSRRAVRAGKVAYLTGDRLREGVLTGLSVRENISLRNLDRVSAMGWLSRVRELRFVREVVQAFAIKVANTESPIESLSGGNQQKALLGSVLVGQPDVILIEEPTQGVDIGARTEIYAMLRRAADSGAVVIILSSDSAELAGVADRVLVMSRGNVIDDLEGDRVTERAIIGAALGSDSERQRVASRSSGFVRWLAGEWAPTTILATLTVLLCAIGSAVNTNFVGVQNVSGVLSLASILGLVACGQLLVLQTGGIDLSVGPLMGFVVIVASFYLVDGADPLAQTEGWLLMFGSALAVGALNWALIDVVRLSPIIATLITYMGIQGASFLLRPTPGGLVSGQIAGPIGANIGPLPVTFLVAVAIAVTLNIGLYRFRAGIALRAVGSREESARVTGLNPRLVRLAAYLGSSLLAGVAGIVLMTQNQTGDSSAGVEFTLLSISAAVVGGASVYGGRGSFIGALLGAVVVNVVGALIVFTNVPSAWQYYITGAITLGAVVLYSIARRRMAFQS